MLTPAAHSMHICHYYWEQYLAHNPKLITRDVAAKSWLLYSLFRAYRAAAMFGDAQPRQ